MNVKELRKRAAELNITGRSTMDRPELEQAIRTAEAELESQVGTIVKMDDAPPAPPVATEDAFPVSWGNTHARKVARDINTITSMRYGMRGRGMGAKHYMLGRPPIDIKTRGTDADKPLSYADRVRHYAKQNGQSVRTADEFDGALLTHRQWRRAVKKQNQNRAFGTKVARY